MTSPGMLPQTVSGLLALRAASSPGAVAFWQPSSDNGWKPISWGVFAGQVASLRRALEGADLRPGDRVALIAPVSLEWELLHHAALSLGAIVVGMDAHDLPARIAAQAELANVAAFVTSDPRAVSAIETERLASARFILDLSGTMELPAGARRLTWPDLLALGGPALERLPGPQPSDLATIIFTSGTTGAPKGIAYTHEQVCLAIDTISGVFGFVDERSQLLCWLPLSNLFQRMVNLAAMRKGAATHLLNDPRQVMTAVATATPDIFVGVPRFYEKLYEGIRDQIAAQPLIRRWLIELAWSVGRRVGQARLEHRIVPVWLDGIYRVMDRTVLRRVRGVMGDRLRCMITGSAPIPKHLLEEFHALGWLVLEAYGLSENVLPMAMNRPEDFRLGTVGRPLQRNEIVVTENSEIKVRGPGLFAGYVGGANPGPLDGDGFYHTGDLGRFDEDGYLILSGRSDDIIKTSTGRRVAPASIEAELRSASGIDQAVILGAGRKCLVALCTFTPGHPHEQALAGLARELRARVARMSEHGRPRGVALLEHPFSIERGELTSNLKLKRAVIESRHADEIRTLYELIDRNSSDGDALVVIRPGHHTSERDGS